MSFHRIGAQYQATPPTVGDKQISELQVDANGRLLVSGGTGTSSVTMQGAAADDSAVVGNPVLVAGKYESTLNTQETGDVSTLKTDANGRLLVLESPQTTSDLSVATVATSTATTTELVSATASQTTRVHRVTLNVAGANVLTFKSSATQLREPLNFTAAGFLVLDFDSRPWYKTATAEALNLTTSTTAVVNITVDYIKSV